MGNCRALGHRGFKVSRHQSGRASACLTEVTAGASATPSPTLEPQGEAERVRGGQVDRIHAPDKDADSQQR